MTRRTTWQITSWGAKQLLRNSAITVEAVLVLTSQAWLVLVDNLLDLLSMYVVILLGNMFRWDKANMLIHVQVRMIKDIDLTKLKYKDTNGKELSPPYESPV